MKKLFFHDQNKKIKAVGNFSEREDGPMNYVGHPAYDSDRRNNRHKFLNKIKFPSAHHTVEVKVLHGGVCEVVDLPAMHGSLQCDAVLTDKKGLVLTMTAADCPTVYLVDPASEVCGLLHCGWRPVSVCLIENTIERATASFNVNPADLWAFIGPGICARCFEIGPDVASVFGVSVHDNGKILFSLNEEIIKRLVACGLDKTKILMSGECTKCGDSGVKYYSWRRDRSDPLDAQMAVLALK